MSYLTINKSFTTNSSKEELLSLLKASEESAKAGGFYCKNLGDSEFKINARFSLGTLHFSGGFGNSIGVRLKLSSTDSIRVYSKIRPEHYFILLTFSVFFFAAFSEPTIDWESILFTSVMLIICHLWFQLIYRVQENYLIKRVSEYLGLKEVKKYRS